MIRMNFTVGGIALCLALGGCTSLLPRATSSTLSPFESFGRAQQAAEKIIPFKTQAGQLAALGFDPDGGKNVTLVPYPDIIARLVPYPGIGPDQLDPGIRACIDAQTACRGYVFRFRHEDRTREGNFLADFFNVRRVTHVTAWWFEAVVVVSGDKVLFRNVAGEERVDRVDRQTNPLGPLQPAGEGAGSLLLR